MDYFRRLLSRFDRHTLTRIYCGDNQLLELPEELYAFGNLDVLAVENNRLQSMPSAIAKCKKLRVLYLNENCLKQNSFPSQMIELTNVSVYKTN